MTSSREILWLERAAELAEAATQCLRASHELPPAFRSRIQIGSDGCWVWVGARDPRGYGRYTVGPKYHSAHRYAYEAIRGVIPDGLELDHLCRNTSCVNPAHLDPVTHRENIRRGEGWGAKNARKTHCPSGHPYSPENTRMEGSSRRCRRCAAIRWAKKGTAA